MPAITTTQVTASIRVVGGLLPADMINRIMTGKDVSASTPADYHVVGVRSVKDAAERHWDYLKGAWRVLRDAIGYGSDPRGLATENWLLPLFDEHGYGRLARLRAGITADDGIMVFPVSHAWQHLPIHLVPWGQNLDKRPVAGELPPQSMVQDCLNRTAGHLWGIVSNGSVLRLLRDTTSLTGAAYLEVDLAAMFDGELFEDFVLLYRLLHVSRFEVADAAPVSSCRMERWRTEAIEAGTRALDQLRDGVKDAIIALGTGFLKHPANAAFREDFDKDQTKRALLRLVYRLLFWFVAEDRDALHAPRTDEKTMHRYTAYFSARRLRGASMSGAGTAHGDLWRAVRLILSGLGAEGGLPHLGLPGLGGIYDDTSTDEVLADLELSNEQLLTAVKSLSRVRDKSTNRWRRIDYRNLGAEELGAIYESLLELVPDRDGLYTFVLRDAAGNDRKSTGSYYTPTSLIDCLLDSTLDPVLDDATKQAEIVATAAGTDVSAAVAEALLSVTVCDPACGSGHFLVAAARRIAKRVAAVREHNPEPTLESLRTALRDVITRCIYGVDLNPMAVELAKVSLWLEALDPGKPLSFLDAHVKQGNALIGATPKLIDQGIPDAAFKPVEGDDEKWARFLAKTNEKQRTGQGSLFEVEDIAGHANTQLAEELLQITTAAVGSLRDVHGQAAAYRDWVKSAPRLRQMEIANAWCAAFMWHKSKDAPPAVTYDVFHDLKKDEPTLLAAAVAAEVATLRDEYGFFHWHLEFPQIFRVPDGGGAGSDPDAGWAGGFTVLLGNPPWDKVDFKDQEYFSAVDPSIAALPGQRRRARIVEWEQEHPDEGERYRAAKRSVKATFHFVGDSGAFPRCAKGLTLMGVTKLQTDQLFAERFAELTASTGRVGCIVPTAIATAAGGQYLFSSFASRSGISSLYDFDNRKPLFPTVDSRYNFCLLSLTGKALREPVARYAFFLEDVPDLDDPDRVFGLGPEELALINPNTGTLPIFRNQRDAALTVSVYQRVPVLWDEKKRMGNPWGITLKNLFHMTDDSDLFHTHAELDVDGWRLEGNVFTRGGERMLPLYEAKLVHHFDHRWNSFYGPANDDNRHLTLAEKQDPTVTAQPRYWIAAQGPVHVNRKGREVALAAVSEILADVKWERSWLCGWRDVCRATDERTAIPAFIPRAAVGNKFPLMFPTASPDLIAALIATQSSLVFDFVSRQKVGGIAMGVFIWKQLPVPTPTTIEPHLDFIIPRVLELAYTAYDMTPFARDLGDEGEPFRWDEDRRTQLRAELDAFFFHLYGIEDRNDVDYILETFQTETGGLKHNEIRDHGEYRTKRLVLTEYDRMAAGHTTGVPYKSPLATPPGQGPRHLPREN
jgi:N-6 DNA Methylase